jgi:hypothetical protein
MAETIEEKAARFRRRAAAAREQAARFRDAKASEAMYAAAALWDEFADRHERISKLTALDEAGSGSLYSSKAAD